MINHFRGEHGWLSNFYEVPIYYRGMTYRSVEAAYQACRSDREDWKEFCANPLTSQSEMKRRGKTIQLRENWNLEKVDVMKDLLDIKFTNPAFRDKLLATKDQNIVEGNEWKDDFWGVRTDVQPNYGENHLGRLIMKVREEIR